MRYFIVAIVLVFPLSANACKLLSYEAEKTSERSVIVQGSFNKSHTKVLIEVFNDRQIVGSRTVNTSSNGSFIVKVQTLTEVSIFPKVKGFCVTR